MDEAIWLLWQQQSWGDADVWVLHGVFLTQSIANRRCVEMQNEHGGEWVVQRREIGVLGEQEIN